jgi:carboxyl-terminal processing protease
VLASTLGKALYDQTGAESSILSHIYGNTLYLAFNKISPTTLQEFAYTLDAASTTPLTHLILDMRGNVGGQLSFAQDFLGLFLGGNQYAFDLYHQGDTEPQRTTQNKFPDLTRFKDIAVLTDDMTQSTAELTTAALKRFRIATVVGTKTRGWGSVEDTYPMKTEIDPATSYALLLVNHLTLRDDQEPIEQNGVLPDVDTTETGWQKKLGTYVAPDFANVIEARLAAEPLR